MGKLCQRRHIPKVVWEAGQAAERVSGPRMLQGRVRFCGWKSLFASVSLASCPTSEALEPVTKYPVLLFTKRRGRKTGQEHKEDFR